jgi:hypothetical protein
LRATKYPARAGRRERALDDFAVERKAVDVHQQGNVILADLGHVAVAKVSVVEAGALALVDGEAEMRKHVALRLDEAWVDVVPIERDDAVHFASSGSVSHPRVRAGTVLIASADVNGKVGRVVEIGR